MYIRDQGKGQSIPRPPSNYGGTAFRGNEPISPEELIGVKPQSGSVKDGDLRRDNSSRRDNDSRRDDEIRRDSDTRHENDARRDSDLRRDNDLRHDDNIHRDHLHPGENSSHRDDDGAKIPRLLPRSEPVEVSDPSDGDAGKPGKDIAGDDRPPGRPEEKRERPKDDKNPLKGLFSALMPPGFNKPGHEGAFGFEELLIVGLIFLLSQSEEDTDILILLALLLFFK